VSYPARFFLSVFDDPTAPVNLDPDRLGRLEARLARLEAHLGLAAAPEPGPPAVAPEVPPAVLARALSDRAPRSDDFELELGQHWFALAGAAILTAGVMFLLSLPYAGLPAALPALAGFVLSAALLFGSRLLPPSLSRATGALRASGMALLGFSALRLSFFGPTAAINPDGPVALALVLAVTAVNATLAVRQRSVGLTLLALTLAAAMGLTAGATALVLATIVGLAGIGVIACHRLTAPFLPLATLGLTYVTYLSWAAGNPFRTGAVHFVREPALAPLVLLAAMLGLGVIPLLRTGERDDVLARVTAFSNCALGYGVFLLHTVAALPAHVAFLHAVAAIGLLGLAVAYFLRTEGRVVTFFYAMTGYAALSVAIMKLSAVPGVFVWLSVQSLVVVATAIWFRSRFIIVANFVIFALIVVAYMIAVKGETGISIGFGIVALASARILNWKQHRLELKTDFMRNAYLASAFVVFPYALYHLLPLTYRALAWIALAGVYYLLTVVFRNQKYRWMGHGTLVIATVYVVALGVSRFSPVYRVLSFLALGATLLTVSLLFARSRRRTAGPTALSTPPNPPLQ